MQHDNAFHSEYTRICNVLRETADALDSLRRASGDGGVEPHAGAAMWGVRFAVAVLLHDMPCQMPPEFDVDTERLLGLCANWRDAAFDIGEFAPEAGLRLVTGGEDA